MSLFDRAIGGDQAALARLCTRLENDDPAVLTRLDELGPPAFEPHVIGITGPPGAGKSSLINSLLSELTSGGGRVAVLLIDPSSQASGGAVLGDRVRMLSWGSDDVFVRSQATRGQEGGLAAATGAMIDLFAHAKFPTVVIETVGVGQDGIDVRKVCDTTIVVQSPHAGDEIQTMKAGILEIADILVVSKADLAGSHRTVRDLNAMVHSAPAQDSGWIVPVVPVSTVEDTGWSQLGEQIERHRASLRTTSPRSAVQDRRNWEIEKRAVAAIARAVDSIGSTAGMTRSDAVSSVLAHASELTGPH